ncbi:MAG: hypothetical protein J6U85_07805 [Bacteroidales bacterium]|nr:hypothetical protein [Bacteroidales bacterium]
MKRIFTILMALMILGFTQCKPTPDGGEENNVRKVKVTCRIPINKGSRSDFTNLMENGSIQWSSGTERVYVAIQHDIKPQIIELRTDGITGNPNILSFEGAVEEGLLVEGEQYEVWYLGNSMNLSNSYVDKVETDGIITSIEGCIANQSGKLADIGRCHIASCKVIAEVATNGDVELQLYGVLKSNVAIAYLDLKYVTELKGDAIIGTNYKLEYNSEYKKFEFNVVKDVESVINISNGDIESFVVFFPNEKFKVKMYSSRGFYVFKSGIEPNRIYYRYISELQPKEPLYWSTPSYVDLGLPSGLKWAVCNIGAYSPEEYGKYYLFGDPQPKRADIASSNWGGNWRTPSKENIEELLNNCTWEWTMLNGVNGYKVIGLNGNSIFFPAAGYHSGSSLYSAGSIGEYWSSTVISSFTNDMYYLSFNSTSKNVYCTYKNQDWCSIRPVIK